MSNRQFMNPGLAGVKVGDMLIVTNVNARKGAPPPIAIVTKVGRVNVQVTDEHGNEWAYRKGFRIADGSYIDDYGHQSAWTPEAWGARCAAIDADRRLRELGVTVDYRFKGDVIALAAFVEEMTKEESS